MLIFELKNPHQSRVTSLIMSTGWINQKKKRSRHFTSKRIWCCRSNTGRKKYQLHKENFFWYPSKKKWVEFLLFTKCRKLKPFSYLVWRIGRACAARFVSTHFDLFLFLHLIFGASVKYTRTQHDTTTTSTTMTTLTK